MKTKQFSRALLRTRQNATGKKEFVYSVRLPIPEKSSKVALYGYAQVLVSFVDKLCGQLKNQGRKFTVKKWDEGYDNIRGKYINRDIIAYTNVNNEIEKKVIWITQ